MIAEYPGKRSAWRPAGRLIVPSRPALRLVVLHGERERDQVRLLSCMPRHCPELSMTIDQGLAFAVVGGMMVLFISGRLRYDHVAVVAFLASVFVGIVPHDNAFSGFGDDIVVILGSALVVSAAMARSGVMWRPYFNRSTLTYNQAPTTAATAEAASPANPSPAQANPSPHSATGTSFRKPETGVAELAKSHASRPPETHNPQD